MIMIVMKTFRGGEKGVNKFGAVEVVIFIDLDVKLKITSEGTNLAGSRKG